MFRRRQYSPSALGKYHIEIIKLIQKKFLTLKKMYKRCHTPVVIKLGKII